MSETILIIDDDERLADMLREYLSRAGFVVEARHTGGAGVAAVAASTAKPYAAVILDVMLPDID